MSQIPKILGVGLGPANLALAVLVQERALSGQRATYLFCERKPSFSWHEDMLLPGAQLQVPFLRDLATVRNPRSPFTFLNYLKEKGRLDQFINLRTFYPFRKEFHSYLEWVCDQLSHLVKFNCDVEHITPVWDKEGKTIRKLDVLCFDRSQQELYSLQVENIVLAVGKEPYIPKPLENIKDKIGHTSDLLTVLSRDFKETQKNYSFTVIGAGQSSAEAILYLLETYPYAEVHWCFRGYALHSAEDNPFINQLYHQHQITDFFYLPQEIKAEAFLDLERSNYSAIDSHLLVNLFKTSYMDDLESKKRISFNKGFEIKEAKFTNPKIAITFQNLFSTSCSTLHTDALILGTGYVPTQHKKLLLPLEDFLKKDPKGDFITSQEYRILTKKELNAGVYLQGYCENSHGPGDATLSNLSTRAEIIGNSIEKMSGLGFEGKSCD